MGTSEGKYNIKAVANMLSIQPGTLRAWERRYQIITPKRNEAGHRLYTEEHVKILKWLLAKVNEGFTIGQAVSLLETSHPHIRLLESGESRTDSLIDALLFSLIQFDETKAHEYLDEAFSIFTVEKVTIDVLSQVLKRLGNLWAEKKITSAHEHYATSFLRSRIGMLYHNLPVNTVLPKVIAVCGPNECHELGLLIFTLYLRRKGYQVIYLGTSIDEADIHVIIKEIKPRFVFLACTLQSNVVATIKLANRIHEQYDYLSVGLGGAAFQHLTEQVEQDLQEFLLGETREDWDRWLMQG